jgi:hypothetical protein
MKRLKITYILIIITLFFTSCASKENDKNFDNTLKNKSSKYCINEISLFSIDDSLQEISIDYDLEEDSIMKFIEKELNKDLCWNLVSFGIELPNNNPIKVQLLKKCNSFCRTNFYSEVSILLNQNGISLIQNEFFVPIDSIKHWIHKNFPSNNSFDKKEISIKWTKETPKDSIEKTFVNIVDGYLLNYEDLSHNLFSKSICDLSENQIESLKSELPFKVTLEMGTITRPQAPPI